MTPDIPEPDRSEPGPADQPKVAPPAETTDPTAAAPGGTTVPPATPSAAGSEPAVPRPPAAGTANGRSGGRQAPPSRPVTDADRQAAADLLRAACGDGRLTLDEFSDRVGTAWAAESCEDLARATEGITPPPVGIQRSSSTLVNIIGNGRRLGRWRVPRRTVIVNLVGDWTLDMRGALMDATAVADGVVDIRFVSLIGDLTISVPDGMEVEMSGLVVLGDRHLELAAVPERPGTPRLRLRLAGLIGDVRVRSASQVGR